MTQESRQKLNYLELFKMKYKAFFIILKGLLLKKIKQFFLEEESPTLNVRHQLIKHPLFHDKDHRYISRSNGADMNLQSTP